MRESLACHDVSAIFCKRLSPHVYHGKQHKTYQNVVFGHLSPLLRQERRMSVHAFVQNDANAPLVTPGIVGFAGDYLRSHVLACADDTHG